MFIRRPVRSTTASVARISLLVLLEKVGVLVKTNMILELPIPPMMPMAKRITPVTILAVRVGCFEVRYDVRIRGYVSDHFLNVQPFRLLPICQSVMKF